MKIFASDYDGTLNQNGPLTKNNLELIDKFRNQGNKFGIVTGRTVHSIMHELEKYKIPYDFIVAINGGLVLDSHNNELFSRELEPSLVSFVSQRLIEEEVLYYGEHDGYGMSQYHVAGENLETDINIDISDSNILKENGIKGLFARTQSHKHAKDIAKKLNRELEKNDVVIFQNAWNLDVGKKGIDKASGLKIIIKHFNGSKDKVFTVGDGHNDVPMLEAYNGFVMNNADSDLKGGCLKEVDSAIEALERVMAEA